MSQTMRQVSFLGQFHPTEAAIHMADLSASFDAAEFMRQDLLPKARGHSCQVRLSAQSSEEPNHARLSFSGCLMNSVISGKPP